MDNQEEQKHMMFKPTKADRFLRNPVSLELNQLDCIAFLNLDLDLGGPQTPK